MSSFLAPVSVLVVRTISLRLRFSDNAFALEGTTIVNPWLRADDVLASGGVVRD